MIWTQLVAIGNANTGQSFPPLFTLVYGIGFLAAVVGGSIAWYNSKRPAGWEDAQRPSFIPKLKTGEENESGEAEE